MLAVRLEDVFARVRTSNHESFILILNEHIVLGRTLNVVHDLTNRPSLPEPEAMFSNDAVKHVFTQMKRFSLYLPKLKEAVSRADYLVRSPAESAKEVARNALNAASLRRVPYRVFKKLLCAGVIGQLVSMEEALPQFWTDDMTEIPFTEFISAVASA